MKELEQKYFNSWSSAAGEFVKSSAAGGAASLVDITFFSIFTSFAGINYLLSNVLSFVFGLITNYLLNREWVFRGQSQSSGKDFLVFSLIGVIGLAISSLLLYILIDLRILYLLMPDGAEGLMKAAAKCLVIVLVFIWNFVARKKFVFSG